MGLLEALGRSQVTVSHSLKLLYEARLVEPRAAGELDPASGGSRARIQGY